MSFTTHAPSTPDTDDVVVAAVEHWLERAVIGLNLCPFARSPWTQGRVRLCVSHASDADALLQDLDTELARLRDHDPEELETTLLIHPRVLADFDAYNDFLGIAELAVRMRGLEGEIQVASFHPDYRFEGTAPADIENYTNRSPFPILHLLRESSIDAAVDAMPDTDAIYARNIATLQRLGITGWDALWTANGPKADRPETDI